jgi:hypothetical protein
MVGSFTAEASAVLPGAGAMKKGDAVRLLFDQGRIYGQLNLSTDAFVSGALFSLDGRKSATVINRRLGPGVYFIPLQNRVQGMRVLRISVGNREFLMNIL